MTNPLPMPGSTGAPLRLFLRGEAATAADIAFVLRDAAADAQRRINKLETKNGIGSVVRQSQLKMVRQELFTVQSELWKSVGKVVRTGGQRIADAAAEAEAQVQEVLFRAVGAEPPSVLAAAQREYARATVRTFLARGENGIGLSEQVYRTRSLAQGWVDREINRVILQGGGWQDLAARVRPMIDPDVKGGVSYAAKRLGRTELANAFHTTQRALAVESPYVEGMKWNLSRSHPKKDKCDDLARGHSKGKPTGVYEPGRFPSKPHPQCLCYGTEEVMDEDAFLDSITRTSPTTVAGQYRAAARSA